MKKISIIAAAAAIAVTSASSVVAETAPVASDPFVSTQGGEVSAIAILAGVAAIIAITAGSSGTD